MTNHRRAKWLVAANFAGLLLLSNAAAHADGVVVYAGYGGAYQVALRKATLTPVARELGITIRDETISSLSDVKVQVRAGRVEISITEQNVNDCLVGSQQNLWEPLDYQVIRTDGIPANLIHKDWVGGSTYWWTVLTFNKDKYRKIQPNSWADFWDVKKFPGTRAMYNFPYHNIELALLADGVTPDKLYPLDLDRAFKKLREIKPYITVWFTSGAQASQLVTDGEIDMLPFWNGRASKLIDEGVPVGFTLNQSLISSDCIVIPRGAPNKALAMQVVNRMLAPDIQAALAQAIHYAPVNAKAYENGRISPELAAKLRPAPEAQKLQIRVDDAWWSDLKHAEKVQELWTQLVQH